jgi:MFS transporter, SHS family, lactate transporter
MAISALSGWTSEQKHVVAASFLGWSLDAFDFFLLVFVLKDIAAEFQTDISNVTLAILLTLAMRPIGAFIFGRAADRWGRRPTLMIDILLYSVLEFASGFAPSLTVLIILRALYGVAMGGEWGVGACRNVPESPSWSREAAVERGNTLTVLKSHWRLGIYAVVLMTAFNFFSHGTQDLYPTFLEVEHQLSPHVVGIIAVIYNIGAICGGILFGTLSEHFGRRRCIIIAALLSLPVIPLWAFSDSPALLAIGAFLMQFTVQGAWGVVPVHLNELSPDTARGTFPGFVYQLGNLLASVNATLQAGIALHFNGNYGLALAVVAGSVAIIIAVLTAVGTEAKGIVFAKAKAVVS